MEEGNSVTIKCSFPFELTGLLMTEAMRNLTLLEKNGLLKLTIGYCTIWNIRDEEETKFNDVQSINEMITSESN
jgi:chromosome transmission fidelity protein 4